MFDCRQLNCIGTFAHAQDISVPNLCEKGIVSSQSPFRVKIQKLLTKGLQRRKAIRVLRAGTPQTQ